VSCVKGSSIRVELVYSTTFFFPYDDEKKFVTIIKLKQMSILSCIYCQIFVCMFQCVCVALLILINHNGHYY